MPYKERLKKGLERKREKPKYKVQNWTEYNQREAPLRYGKGSATVVW